MIQQIRYYRRTKDKDQLGSNIPTQDELKVLVEEANRDKVFIELYYVCWQHDRHISICPDDTLEDVLAAMPKYYPA